MTRSAADVGGFFCTQNHQTNKMEERIWNFSIRQSTFSKFWLWLLVPVWRYGASSTFWKVTGRTTLRQMLMYGREASNRKQEIDRQHHTIPNKRTKDKHYGNVHNRLWNHG